MGKVDTETENYGVKKEITPESISSPKPEERILAAVKGISGVNTVDVQLTVNTHTFQPTANFVINGVLTPINYNLELIQDIITTNNTQFVEKVIELITEEIKEFITTGKLSSRKTITKKVEEVDGKLMESWY